jgi:hypothetical protein
MPSPSVSTAWAKAVAVGRVRRSRRRKSERRRWVCGKLLWCRMSFMILS